MTRVVSIYDDYDHIITPGSFLFVRSEPGESPSEYLMRYQRWFYARLKEPRFKALVDHLKNKKIAVASYPYESVAGIVKEYLDHNKQ